MNYKSAPFRARFKFSTRWLFVGITLFAVIIGLHIRLEHKVRLFLDEFLDVESNVHDFEAVGKLVSFKNVVVSRSTRTWDYLLFRRRIVVDYDAEFKRYRFVYSNYDHYHCTSEFLVRWQDVETLGHRERHTRYGIKTHKPFE